MTMEVTQTETPTTDGTVIEPVTTAELGETVELCREFHDRSPYGPLVEYDEWTAAARLIGMIATGDVLFAMKADGKVVGVCGAIITSAFFNLDVRMAAEVFMYVVDAHRSDDAAHQLREAVRAEAKKRGATLVLNGKGV